MFLLGGNSSIIMSVNSASISRIYTGRSITLVAVKNTVRIIIKENITSSSSLIYCRNYFPLSNSTFGLWSSTASFSSNGNSVCWNTSLSKVYSFFLPSCDSPWSNFHGMSKRIWQKSIGIMSDNTLSLKLPTWNSTSACSFTKIWWPLWFQH